MHMKVLQEADIAILKLQASKSLDNLFMSSSLNNITLDFNNMHKS